MQTDPTLVTIPKKAHDELLFERRVLDMVQGTDPEVFVKCVELARIPLIGETDDPVHRRVLSRIFRDGEEPEGEAA